MNPEKVFFNEDDMSSGFTLEPSSSHQLSYIQTKIALSVVQGAQTEVTALVNDLTEKLKTYGKELDNLTHVKGLLVFALHQILRDEKDFAHMTARKALIAIGES